ncbi:MAG: molybdenum ABC transporter ATP-binding protein [Thermodesulfobacteriota bacterium]
MELRMKVEKRLGNFSLEADFIVEGERVGVFGESGSGKSTLVAILAGLRAPDRGEIALDGVRLFDGSARIDVPPERRRIGIVFQQPCLFPHMSVRSNLLYGYKRRAAEQRSVGFDALVDALQLEGLLARGVSGLSGGERQRVALGRAVLASPRLLLMDEPLSAMDEGLKLQIIPFLLGVSERFRIPFLFISHSLMEMRLMTDEAIVLAGGRIAERTTPDALARSRMGQYPSGYANLLALKSPRRRNGLIAFRWGTEELLLSGGAGASEGLFELSSRDILICKQHPEAISARNLLKCAVSDIFTVGERIAAELSCGGNTLVTEMTGDAAAELGIVKGCELYAAIKASAFRRLG